jgi:hypothetical protein
MEIAVIIIGLLLAVGLGYLLAAPLDMWRASNYSSADLLNASWSPIQNLWDVKPVKWARKQWPDCEVLTNILADSIVVGPLRQQLRNHYSKRPIDIMVISPSGEITMIYILATPTDAIRRRAGHLRSILMQAEYNVAIIDKDRLVEIDPITTT